MSAAGDELSLASRPAERSTGARSGWVIVFVAAWIISALICLRLAMAPGYPGDVAHYKFWTKLVTQGGVQAAYSGTYPETYSIYPPVTLYAYQVVGLLYQRLVDPAMHIDRMMASQGLTAGIKGVAIGFHLALGLAIFGLTFARHGARWAGITGSVYVLNPAAIFDVAYWAQPDAAHSLWAVLAMPLLEAGRWRGSWLLAGLAAMTKPQAWSLLPLFLMKSFQTLGPARSAIGVVLAGLVSLLIILPFVISGRLREFLTLPVQISSVMPVASANAHNLWWLVTGANAEHVLDVTPLVGQLTYRQVALALVLGFTALVLWRSLRTPSPPLFHLAAYQAFGWFCLTTQAHENHSFFILPLLAMAAPATRAAGLFFAILTGTMLVNMTLHDPLMQEQLQQVMSPHTQWRLQMANATANLLVLAGWTVWLWRPNRVL